MSPIELPSGKWTPPAEGEPTSSVAYVPRIADPYDAGYREGEDSRLADARLFHDDVLDHDPDCDCPLAAFIRHVGGDV